jgi:hypothetical protein
MSVRRKRPREVFISHAHQDRAFVARLIRLLRSHRIRYWYSPKHIVAAQQWHDEIGEALARCDWFLLVLSPSAVRSEWVSHEYLFALNDNRYAGRIVPVLLKQCRWRKLSWTLREFQWVDFTKNQRLANRQLLKSWGVNA